MTELGADFDLDIQRSRLLLALIATTHATAAVSRLYTGLTLALRCALLLAVSLHAIDAVERLVLLRGREVVTGLRWARGRWWLRVDGGWVEGTPAREFVVTDFVVAGRFRMAPSRRCAPLFLLRDSADADSLRRLRVRLRFGGAPQGR